MILYTPIPKELIFPALQEEFQAVETITWQGIPLMVQKEEQQMRILRVLSTNPNDYLNQQIVPGQYLPYPPKQY
ncbi:YlzJ-like family protein [Bacillus smithii]|uniref:YlzJ-like family protein n=1 Tax=Bacillus smithii TaxID=1479 RepID=UPI0022E3EBEA|nr:YlzJ-like family protein [Bacillus smithii]MED0660395.1 YlzJ-like family protein [Bacillus smithii]MED1421627.1 YlzJ-like family protein [Bacillus smithii]MED1457822.1 YlzJ-like family protein [Bacillus smithii]MED1490038.1 YlzJ-like family protein [Bacillus smithii]